QKPRPVTVEIESMDKWGEGRIQCGRVWWVIPPRLPGIVIRRRTAGGEQTDQKLKLGNAKIGTRPVNSAERQILSDLRGPDQAHGSRRRLDRNPGVLKQIERRHGHSFDVRIG